MEQDLSVRDESSSAMIFFSFTKEFYAFSKKIFLFSRANQFPRDKDHSELEKRIDSADHVSSP